MKLDSKTKTDLSAVSVFFPFYNEEQSIRPIVETAIQVFSSISDKVEVLMINDGSSDKTAEIGSELEKEYPRVRLINQQNLGYGGAVKRGFSESKFEWVFFSDGDMQFDLEEVQKFIPFTSDYDLIIGYRKNRSEGIFRHIIAEMLRVWNKILLNFPLSIKDIDCAFKLIKKEVINDITPLKTNGAMLTTEFLLKAHKKGYRIKQLPVTHYNRKHGKSSGSNPKVIMKAVKETFLLKQELKNT